MLDGAGTTTYTYHLNGQLLTENVPWASDTVTYGYNNARLRSSLTLQQPAGSWTQSYGYDASRRLTSLTAPKVSSSPFTYLYQGAGSLVRRVQFPNNAYVTNIYDGFARLTDTRLKKAMGSHLNN